MGAAPAERPAVLVSPLTITVRYDPATGQLEVQSQLDPLTTVAVLTQAWYVTLARTVGPARRIVPPP